jgi:hypothetical protein
MISFLDCPHKRVQEFTECCLDCGYNIYMTKQEYLKILQDEYTESLTDKQIRFLEKSLGKQK